MRRINALLVATAAISAFSVVSAQTPQTGIFYWCSYIEGGSNLNSIGFANAAPRTTVLGLPQTGSPSSAPCHHPSAGIFPFINSDGNSYTYSNGSAYPQNIASPAASLYAIAPSSCMVRFKFECSN